MMNFLLIFSVEYFVLFLQEDKKRKMFIEEKMV